MENQDIIDELITAYAMELETVQNYIAASTNLEQAVERFAPQLQALGGWLLSMAASTGGLLLLLTFSLILAGVLMMQGPACIGFLGTL